jgi:glutathione synthase/RimK-type ligase-like ATP-grasp enzyme
MLVVQNFIPNDCDYRVLVFGGQVKAIMRRTRQGSDTHVNNTSLGGRGDMVGLAEFPKEWQAIALQAAAAVNRSDLAGVDMLIDQTSNKPYVLEVNKSPQIETGSNTDTKTTVFVDYIMEKLMLLATKK